LRASRDGSRKPRRVVITAIGGVPMSATVLPFPRTRCVRFLAQNAAIASSYGPRGAANYINHIVEQQADAPRRCGVYETAVSREAATLRSALFARCETIRGAGGSAA
jgi:hypothetical protein